MRNALVIAVLFTFLPCLAVTQGTPTVDIFGGYSYLRFNPGHGVPSTNVNGWNAAATWNVNRWLGFSGDIDGHYCCDASQSIHNFLFGPRLTLRRHSMNIFTHALVGVSHGSASSFSDTVAAWALGGGVDVNFHGPLALRLAQVDYLGTHYASETQSNFRYSGGIVLRLGSKR